MDALRRAPVIEGYEVVKEVKFYLDGLSTAIKIKVSKVHIPSNSSLDGKYQYELSHHIHTPTQAGPYMTSRPWGDTIENAISDAISGLEMYRSAAISAGHVPSDAWLVLNEDY